VKRPWDCPSKKLADNWQEKEYTVSLIRRLVGKYCRSDYGKLNGIHDCDFPLKTADSILLPIAAGRF
jgi:hypothetical protein